MDMVDIHEPEIVVIAIDHDGTLWVNVDGKCRLRITRPSELAIDMLVEPYNRLFAEEYH